MKLDQNYSVSLSLVALLIITIFVSPISFSPWHLRTVSAEGFSNSTSNLTNPALTNSTQHLTNPTLTNSTSNLTNSTLTNSTSNLTNSTLTNSTQHLTNSTLTNSTQHLTNSTLTNSTQHLINSTLTNSTQHLINSTLTNSTSNLTNSTLTNSTQQLTNPTLTNSTSNLTNSTVTNSTQQLTNSTFTNSTTYLTRSVPTNPVNDTLSYQNSIKNENSILNVTNSLNFDSLQNSTIHGDVTVIKNSNGTSLSLVGSGYVKENIDSTRELSKLTLSMWVKPDYSQGSPQFTIISKENSFVLAINNNISPSHVAIFSIFDGIKWNTINSTTKIPEEWTNIVGTYNGTHIQVYINGKLESRSAISGIPTMSINGHLETKKIDSLSSNADVVVGAYYNSLRDKTNNLFSGSLQYIKIIDHLLSDSQIQELYHQNIPSNDQTTTYKH